MGGLGWEDMNSNPNYKTLIWHFFFFYYLPTAMVWCGMVNVMYILYLVKGLTSM